MKQLLIAALLSAVSVAIPTTWPSLVPFATALEYTTTPQKTSPANGCTNITPNASAFAYSSWVEFMSAAANTTGVVLTGVSADPAVNGGEWLLDVGTGGAGSETTVAYLFGQAQAIQEGRQTSIYVNAYPGVAIPAGTRVAARFRKFGTNTTNWCFALTYHEAPLSGFASTSSFVTAVGGLGVTPNAGAWVNSAWVQETASTPAAIDIFRFTSSWVCSGNPGYDWEWDIGTGAAASETVVRTIRGKHLDTNGICTLSGGQNVTNIWPPVHIPASTRVALRVRKSNTSVTQLFPTLVWNEGQSLPRLYSTATSVITPSNATGTTITAGGAAWLAGAWTEMIASTSGDIAISDLHMQTVSVGGSIDYEMEIGVGGAGAEVTKWKGRWIGNNASAGDYNFILRPAVNVASGQRVSLRFNDSSASAANVRVNLTHITAQDFDQRTDLIGAAYPPTSTGSVSVTPNASAWVDSSWTQLTATTAHDILLTSLVFRAAGTVPREIEVDLGTGAAASEVVATTFRTHVGAIGDSYVAQLPLTYPLYIRAGNRLAVRMRGSGTATTAYTFAVNYLDDYTPPAGGLSNPIKYCCTRWIAPAGPWLVPALVQQGLRMR